MTGTMTMPPPMPINPARRPAPAPEAKPRQMSHNTLIVVLPLKTRRRSGVWLAPDPDGDVVARDIHHCRQGRCRAVRQRGGHDPEQQADCRYEDLFHDVLPQAVRSPSTSGCIFAPT